MNEGGAPPRRLGLLDAREAQPGRRPTEEYPYPLGYRIAGDLTIIGHLAAGKSSHLYQVWSARDWCAYTCKIVSPDRAPVPQPTWPRCAANRASCALWAIPTSSAITAPASTTACPTCCSSTWTVRHAVRCAGAQPGRRLEISDAVRAAIHLGAALYHLHRRGFLHLDLKPANLLLRDGVPVLIDLDSARRSDPERRPSRCNGTAPYMAPEQVRARRWAPPPTSTASARCSTNC
jgi:eukaryotic-like serine/threonine-protein kinase